MNEEGNQFTAAYYSGKGGKGHGAYINDYEHVLAVGLPTVYHVEDSWENYDIIAPIISRRFAEWRASGV